MKNELKSNEVVVVNERKALEASAIELFESMADDGTYQEPEEDGSFVPLSQEEIDYLNRPRGFKSPEELSDIKEYLDYCTTLTQEDIDVEEDAFCPYTILSDPNRISKEEILCQQLGMNKFYKVYSAICQISHDNLTDEEILYQVDVLEDSFDYDLVKVNENLNKRKMALNPDINKLSSFQKELSYPEGLDEVKQNEFMDIKLLKAWNFMRLSTEITSVMDEENIIEEYIESFVSIKDLALKIALIFPDMVKDIDLNDNDDCRTAIMDATYYFMINFCDYPDGGGDEPNKTMKGGDASAEVINDNTVKGGGDELIKATDPTTMKEGVNVLTTKEMVRQELGYDFGKAVSFWKQLRYIDGKVNDTDYLEMLDAWKVLTALTDSESICNDLLQTAEALRDILCPNVNVMTYSQDELVEFINSSIKDFSLSVFSERLKKENIEITKMALAHIDFDNNGFASFNSEHASKFTGKEVDVHSKNKDQMRIVESAEDGISRMLAVRNLSSVIVSMGEDSEDEYLKAILKQKKTNVFLNGFTDVATGKHYMFAFQNPSSNRKANFMFVEANNWSEVVDLWLEITGLKTWKAFCNAFFDKEGKVVMTKLLARISTRGSNSFNLSKVSPERGEQIKKANIDYFVDPQVEIIRDFKTMAGPGMMTTKSGIARTITPGDGQMIGSFKFHALMAVAMRAISDNEYNDFISLWNKVDCNVKNVKEGTRLYKLIKKIPGVFQLRHGEKKGICVRYNLEAIPELADKDALVPVSVRKFIAGEWNEFPLEICNYIKKKGDMVKLNAQFIEALGFDNPDSLLPVVDYWFNLMQESLTDIAKAQQFHGIIKSSDKETDSVASNLVDALRTSSDLIDDAQICNWRRDQYRKFIDDMKIGRLMVPGQYSYMVCDPAMIISKAYGVDLPHLQSGEFYFNGKECECALFRAPLIHPFEARKVQLINNHAYWYMQDVIVFNGYDGTWEDMGGGSL